MRGVCGVDVGSEKGLLLSLGVGFSLVETWRLRAMLVWERLVVL